MDVKESPTKVSSTEGRVSDPIPDPAFSSHFNEINFRLSRIEEILGLKQTPQDELSFEFACREYLKGNKQPLIDYFNIHKEEQ